MTQSVAEVVLQKSLKKPPNTDKIGKGGFGSLSFRTNVLCPKKWGDLSDAVDGQAAGHAEDGDDFAPRDVGLQQVPGHRAQDTAHRLLVGDGHSHLEEK